MEAKEMPEVKKTIDNMTREEIENVPDRNWDEDIGEFDSLIILPLEEIHDSGYRMMDFVAVKDGLPIRRLSGCSDVIHIGGIGGRNYRDNPITGRMVMAGNWSIDCLEKSGLFRLFSHDPLVCGIALSSFEVFISESKKNSSLTPN